MKKDKSLPKWVGKITVLCGLICCMLFGYIQKVHADHYSPWLIISVSGVKEKRVIYNGSKPMIQLYQDIQYRRTYTDNAGRVSYQYKTEERKLGLKSPYAN